MNQSHYSSARQLSGLLEITLVLATIAGAIFAIMSFTNGTPLGYGIRFPNEISFGDRVLALVPGVVVVISSLLALVFVAAVRATLETADLTRALFLIAKDGADRSSVGPVSNESAALPQKRENIGQFASYIYKGISVSHNNVEYQVGKKTFSSSEAAERYIDQISPAQIR